MTTQPTASPCAFCGHPMLKAAGRQRTREHGFPRWMLKYIGEPGGTVTHTIREGLSGPVMHQWTTDELDLAARRVCKGCNNGWMHKLEGLAEPHLAPLIQGQLRVLDAPAQRILAAWGYQDRAVTRARQ